MTTGAAAVARAAETEGKNSAAPNEKPRRRWGAADVIIGASVALVVVIVGIFVLLCIQGFSSTMENTRERAQRAAAIVADETQLVVSSALASLGTVAALLGDAPLSSGAEVLATTEVLAAPVPVGMSLGLYDALGNRVATGSSAEMPASINGADYFEILAEGGEWALGVQEEQAESGSAAFAVARRLQANGTFAGVALALVDASVLGRIAQPQDLGPQSSIGMVRTDGWVIARDPPLDEPLNMADTVNFQNLGATPAGSYNSSTSPADGVARIVGFKHVEELGYVAVASISTEAAFAGLWTSIWIVSLLIAPIAVALLVGSFMTAKVLRRSQDYSLSLAAALEHNEALFREIHHRVKNNLQSINSLLQLHPIPREVRADMSQRISAMSAVHEHIYRSNVFSEVRVKDYLHTLIENIRAGQNSRVQVNEEIHDVAVDKDAATPLGLIVNEVVSNAFKHAFVGQREGVITVSLKALGDGRATLTVRDNGVGFDPDSPVKGIGRRLVQGFTTQLEGESRQFNEGGSVFTLTFPLAKG